MGERTRRPTGGAVSSDLDVGGDCRSSAGLLPLDAVRNGAGRPMEELEAAIGVRFADPVLLLSALTHRSFLNEAEVPDSGDNERLEFLGDAFLDFVAGEHVYRRVPDAREGELTALRSVLVCEPTLAEFARRIGLGDYVRLGRGEACSGGRQRPAILCDAFEALVGALLLDRGAEAARIFLLPLIEDATEKAIDDSEIKDAKSRFQELAQRAWQITPQYRTVAESGPDHEKVFVVAVMVGDEEWGLGEGHSKSAAARRAARAAIARLQRTGACADLRPGD